MSELTEQLDKIIQQAALDGALTQKAVDQFHSIFTQNTALEVKVAALEETLEDRGKVIKNLETRNTELSALQGGMAQRENEVAERETKCTELELRAEYQLVRVNDHKEMFTTVFRNSVLRKEVMTAPVPGAPDQYGNRAASEFASKDTVEEEEK